MSDIIVKFFVVCKTEKSKDNFCNKHKECKEFNTKRVLKRYYNNKDKILQHYRDKYA